MRKTVKKIIILLGIFVLALTSYFIFFQKKGKNDTTYTAIEDANLPVAYMEMYGRRMNCLLGFIEDNRESAGRTNLTILPEDRNLEVVFQDVDSSVKGIQYEIRSLDGGRLVERTVLEDWTQEGGQVGASLPIQNLLTKDEEYTMILAIATDTHPAVYYYTRVMWTDNAYVEEMIRLAADFSEKTMDPEAARELTTYLETEETADNSSLGRVNLKNSFAQLTWKGLPVEREGEAQVSLKELQGILAVVRINYMASCAQEDGSKEYFDVTETFTMKWNSQRIYMMDYDRRVNEIFSGGGDLFQTKRIMLGISDGDELRTMTDPKGRYMAFSVNRALWFYDFENESSAKVFTFRKSETDSRVNFPNYGIKILTVSEEGVIDFLVYGYMNRGNHEGTTGVSVYRYESAGNALTERLYLPASEDYWNLRQDIEKLGFLAPNQVLYILLGHTVYGIDMASREYVIVADGLSDENFAVSEDGTRIAWQEGEELYGSTLLHIMDLKSGGKKELRFDDNTIIRLEGFVGSDLVYGLARPGDLIKANGRTIGLAMYLLEIVDDGMEVQTRYEKDGVYVTDVSIQDSRVHLRKVMKTDQGFVKTEEDTLVCNEAVAKDPLEGMGYLASEDKGRLYFVQLPAEKEKPQGVRLNVPKKIVAEENNVVRLKGSRPFTQRIYYSFSQGRMRGAFSSFTEAVRASYEEMGLVTDETGRVCWVRANRSNLKTIKDIQAQTPRISRYLEEIAEGKDTSSDGTKLIDAKGCSLNQVLYFVYAGNPVVAHLGNGSYALIYGYDQYNISCLWFPGTEFAYTEKMGLNDAAAYFEMHGENDFLCFLEEK